MKTFAASAFSTLHDSFLAGQEMTRDALTRLKSDRVDFAFAFARNEHNAEKLIDGIRSEIGPGPEIIGGTTLGVITNDYIGYEGFQAGIMLIASDDMKFNSFCVEGLQKGELETGKKAGEALSRMHALDNPNLLIFYDLVVSDPTSKVPFYQTAPILEGIESVIKEFPPSAGVGYATGTDGRNIEMWNGNIITKDAIMPLVISGNVNMHTTIMHGLKPASDYHVITRVDGPEILEIDHLPALQVVEEHLGSGVELDWKRATYLITLGINRGEKYGPFLEENYVNRMLLWVDQSKRSLVMIEGDFDEGDAFQFMKRSIDTDMIAESAQKLIDTIRDRTAVFAIYISCAGRVKPMFGTEKEEAFEIQDTIGNIPLLGFYSGVEIAKVRGKLMPLDWTGVLCIFSVS